MTGWEMYWITRGDSINEISQVVMFFSGIAAIVTAVIGGAMISAEDKNGKSLLYFSKKSMVVALLSAIILVAVPTTKEMIAITVVPAVVNSEAVQQIPQEVLNLIKSYTNTDTR